MMSYCGTCKNITVLGAGAFGTAMAVVAARNNHKVILLCRYQDQADYINNHNVNPIVFQEYTLSPLIKATSSVNEALAHPDLVIHAIPVQQSFSFLKEISNLLPKSAPVLSTSKGIHVETELLMCGILDEVLDENHPTAFLSGPSFAKEVIAGSPTTVVIGSKQSQTAVFISELLSNQYFRAYVTDDVIGLEIGGALKNPLAIGAGIIEGLGHGANSLVAFIIRGCFEMKKLAIAMGGNPDTLSGLSGIGDLILTTFGGLSRNKAVGLRLGKGEKLQDILDSLAQVAEGVPTAAVVVKLADKYGLELPIFRTVHAFLKGEVTAEESLVNIMNKPPKGEFD